jgi:hypothetical protein
VSIKNLVGKLKDKNSGLRGDIGDASDLASRWLGSGADDLPASAPSDDGGDELPEWAIPVGIGAAVLLLVLVMRR